MHLVVIFMALPLPNYHQRYRTFTIDASILFLPPLPIPEYHKLSGILWPRSIPLLELNMVLRSLHHLSYSYGSERQDWRETEEMEADRYSCVGWPFGWAAMIWHQVTRRQVTQCIKLHDENKPTITRRPSAGRYIWKECREFLNAM